jgi:dipeptidyl aminopeptidase/acylaminoacyl peptidase
MPAKRPMQLEDLFRIKAVGRVAMSPDGARVVFELKRFDLRENKNFTQLMLAEVATGKVRALTHGRHSDTRPAWSPDGRRLAFLSNRESPTGLYVMPMSGGDAVRVTDREGSVSDFGWSPDSRRLAYTCQPLSAREKLERDGRTAEIARAPQYKHVTRLLHKLDGAGWWNGEYAHVWVVGASGGRARRLSSGRFDDSEPRWSPDGRLVSFVSNRSEGGDMNQENTDLYVVRPAGGPARRLTRTQGTVRGHSWSPDGRTVAYVGNAAKAGEGWKHLDRLWLLSVRGGRARELTREIDNHCYNGALGDVTGAAFDVQPPIWSADSSRLYFLVGERGATRLYSRSVRRRDLRCEVGGEVNIMYAQRTGRGGPLALAIGTATNPGDVYVADPADGCRARRLSEVNAAVFARVRVAEPEPFQVKSGGVTLDGWVIKPPGFKRGTKYPAIYEIHGGPTAMYGFSFFHELQWLAAKGYVVAYGNPRGSAGYGLKFMNCTHADWGRLDYKDCMRLADWLFARPYVDRRRVGVTGGSYGGYMTNWLVTHTDRFRAAVTQRSLSNFESMAGTSDYGFVMGPEFGGTPWKDVARLRRQSPLTYVTRCRTPLLIEHEEQDHRCAIEQAEQFFTALKVLGREVELVRFEGESHGLSRGGRPQNRAERLRRILAWFERHMREVRSRG